jgi:hypothetical protein
MKHRLLLALLCAMFLVLGSESFTVVPQSSFRSYGTTTLQMSTSATPSAGAAAQLKLALQKPSKMLTVGVEYAGEALSPNGLSTLSMQLRKNKASAIWTANVQAIQEFAKEQQSARGNFPGPIPIIYTGGVEEMEAAIAAGATAVTLSVGESSVETGQADVVYKISSLQDVESVLAATDNMAQAFLFQGVSAEDLPPIISTLAPGTLCIASVDAMLPSGAEVEQAKTLKSAGIHSVLVQQACVGDAEDLEYTQFLVGGMTSKASSAFKFTGLTGSTNGHFGGVQSSGTVKWRRTAIRAEKVTPKS